MKVKIITDFHDMTSTSFRDKTSVALSNQEINEFIFRQLKMCETESSVFETLINKVLRFGR